MCVLLLESMWSPSSIRVFLLITTHLSSWTINSILLCAGCAISSLQALTRIQPHLPPLSLSHTQYQKRSNLWDHAGDKERLVIAITMERTSHRRESRLPADLLVWGCFIYKTPQRFRFITDHGVMLLLCHDYGTRWKNWKHVLTLAFTVFFVHH